MKKIKNFIETFYFLNAVKAKNKFLFFWILFKIKKKFNNLINYSINKKIKLKIINFYEDIIFFNGNFFIYHALTIYNLINKLKKIDNQKYLEIGSFEGSSAIFFSRFLTNSNLTCVDIWKGVEELSNIDFKVVESNFDKNISKIKFNKIIKIKSESEVFFKNNKEKFSIIYLDGNHFFQNVINDIEQSNLKILCNEIFGEENFIANLIWMKGKEGGNDNQGFGIHHEYILCFARNAELAAKKILLDEKDVSRHIVVLPEANQVVQGEEIYKDGEPFQLINLSKQKDYKVKIPLKGGKTIEWDSYCPQKTIDEYIRIGKLFVGKKGVPYVKSFLADEKDGSKPSSIIESKFGTTKAGGIAIRELFGDGKIFSYPKPPQLIKRIIEITCPPSEESIILDFFGGSATTAHGVLLQNKEDGGNRKYVVVTLPEKLDEGSVPFEAGYRTISDISIARIQKVIEKEKIENAGLRVFELDKSIFESNHSDFELDLRPNTLPNDFSDEQVVVEVLLKLGISLDAAWRQINSRGIQAVLCSETLIVLNRVLTQELLDSVFDLDSFNTLVVLEDALANQDALKANLFFTCKQANTVLRTI